MKKITSLVLAFLFLGTMALMSQGKELTSLNNSTFKTKVWDYKVDKKFKYVGSKPALVDFYANWCKPCKEVHPIMMELAAEYEGRVDFYRVNIDIIDFLPKFEITSIPALLYIKDEKTYTIEIGKKSKEEIKAKIEELLSK